MAKTSPISSSFICLRNSVTNVWGIFSALASPRWSYGEAASPRWSYGEAGRESKNFVFSFPSLRLKINHKNAVDNSEMITQFQRAMDQMAIKLITAHSPEAKGRIE
ncbi:hypothetical protein KKA09_02225, partial [Patescibacteria group bacterium]|nr:hypothetical protein [Patescibacteria group bacterium]